ncbi:MAG: metallophosphoesterase [Chitinophagales bacterium]
MFKRKLVIGDIHGALRALQQCLDRANVTSGDQLIFLGDYADGWSETGQLIDFLIDLQQYIDCVFIKGNHDVFCLNYLKGEPMSSNWFLYGGKATADCYEQNSFDTSKHIDFLSQLKNFYIDKDNKLFIHAGYTSLQGPLAEKDENTYYWDRTLWETAIASDPQLTSENIRYPARFKLFKEIYIGHTPILKYGTFHPMNQLNLWNMDTGAAYNGHLTIMDIDTKQFWQSDLVPTLYPGVQGRTD